MEEQPGTMVDEVQRLGFSVPITLNPKPAMIPCSSSRVRTFGVHQHDVCKTIAQARGSKDDWGGQQKQEWGKKARSACSAVSGVVKRWC